MTNEILEATQSSNLYSINVILSSIKTVIPLLGLGGVIGYGFRYVLERRLELKRKIRQSKERQYEDLLSNLLAFFKGWENKEHQEQFLREVYTKAPLYASDEVIRHAMDYIESCDKNSKLSGQSDKIYSKLVLSIRRELRKIQGESDTNLKEGDITIKKLD